jgi:hypothetical protein
VIDRNEWLNQSVQPPGSPKPVEPMKLNRFLSGAAAIAAVLLTATSTRVAAENIWGSALSLDGTSQWLTVDGMDLRNTPLTIELWAKRESIGTWDSFVGQGWGASSNGLFFALQDNNVAAFSFYSGGLYTTNTYTDSAWHHWAATFDPSTGRRLYRDGVEVAADAATGGYTGTGTF